MAFNNKNGPAEINADATFVVAAGSFPTKANLPVGAAGYLAYVQDTENLTLNVGNGTWLTFQTRAMDYKNEVILEQGTVGGGYNASSVFQAITKIHYASDAPIQLLPTLSFATNYGGWHSTYLYAYYHQGGGGSGTSACKQDWATMTVSTINSRTSCGGAGITSTQPGPKQQNTIGVLLSGVASCYLNFSTDSWTDGGYSSGLVNETYGYATFGANYGYTNGDGDSNVYKLNWGTVTWTATSSGSGGYSTHAKALNTKWDKWYQSGAVASGAYVNIYNNVSDTFSSAGASPTSMQEQETLMGQDWGYWSGYGVGGSSYSTTIFKTDYSSNTTTTVQRGSFNYGHSSGSGCWGPIP
jgi:hypothetical protein